ncbi:13090_t:CDS:2 [Dentiscutata erythropus]|uniref:13090_t:CDS:1 n=1 Tax=Dentiscutata erythropus TaxID=1348616 RepID=A0A9N9II65_9GLOM|nr:13090_t:CDS:2 [Dentiscutata erythropus]
MGNEISKIKKKIIINDKDFKDFKPDNHGHHKKTNSNTGFPVVDYELEEEKHRHEILLKAWNSNFYSPVESILKHGNAKVLDIGCGFGAWIYDMALNYPLSHFTGIDIITPKDSILSNVSLVQADVLKGLKYSDCSFDYIHGRDLLWYITTKDARKLFPVSSYFRNHGIFPYDFYKNLSKIFKENNLEYQVEEKTISFYDSELLTKKFIILFKILKSVILEYTSISSEKYDEILDKVWAEVIEYKTSFRSIRYFGKKILLI